MHVDPNKFCIFKSKAPFVDIPIPGGPAGGGEGVKGEKLVSTIAQPVLQLQRKLINELPSEVLMHLSQVPGYPPPPPPPPLYMIVASPTWRRSRLKRNNFAATDQLEYSRVSII